ncbi:Cell division protein ZapA [Ferriphaselus amnicola]|uniref:Cell division protein ZapA n=1 Tax=Ferriphaselus amnicola TaxID=1188319 RepID=A0A2Z6G8Y0_9PROT|nr:cell division protein ZapA [Ferriphaselus amnicola]BBE49844.1 Cell division protein ZapA [Ferriphaselus amnicola]
MSDNTVKTLEVTLLDREFRVACPEEDEADLLAAVTYLDKKMREIQAAGKTASMERIAVMAALNIAHELLKTRLGAGFDLGEFKRRMQAMQATVDSALAEQDALF